MLPPLASVSLLYGPGSQGLESNSQGNTPRKRSPIIGFDTLPLQASQGLWTALVQCSPEPRVLSTAGPIGRSRSTLMPGVFTQVHEVRRRSRGPHARRGVVRHRSRNRTSSTMPLWLSSHESFRLSTITRYHTRQAVMITFSHRTKCRVSHAHHTQSGLDSTLPSGMARALQPQTMSQLSRKDHIHSLSRGQLHKSAALQF